MHTSFKYLHCSKLTWYKSGIIKNPSYVVKAVDRQSSSYIMLIFKSPRIWLIQRWENLGHLLNGKKTESQKFF